MIDDDAAVLLSRCALGDRRAFELLYKRTAAQLFAVLLSIVKQRAQAEEALQDVYVRVWRNAGDYTPAKGNAIAWLISIARYRAIDIVRAQRRVSRHELASSPQIEERAVSREPPPELAAESQRLYDCMAELRDEQRRSIRLAYLEGLTHGEIADYLDRPLGTVKSWIRRGLEALRQCLET